MLRGLTYEEGLRVVKIHFLWNKTPTNGMAVTHKKILNKLEPEVERLFTFS